ncbi:hypothetical protein Mal48_04090 [Thalassoglobus polymorphus]|uniref:Uncharacterized protein n=1 Tax=Thalassoglobus polymorphus TaxID=2527994 RepID=A0A517QHY6_9PLAN|nr:hypothetical protein Mal48_04090 [Thalassoglobus polymorphus]
MSKDANDHECYLSRKSEVAKKKEASVQAS